MDQTNLNFKEFLSVADQFRLGHLTTEASHPLTTELSQFAIHNLDQALRLCKQVDISALEKVMAFIPAIAQKAKALVGKGVVLSYVNKPKNLY